MNTLFKKGYLLAGVIMAANMFIGNEMKAMDYSKGDNNNINQEKENPNPDASGTQYVQWFFNKVLYRENTINLIGGAVFSVANNYFKWWDYNPGWYSQFVWLGWRSKRFLKDILQFEINLNAVRGTFWLIPGTYNYIKYIELSCINAKKSFSYIKSLHVSYLVAILFFKQRDTARIGFFLFQGFVSIPLTLHFSKFNFSISISLDSIIWGVAGMIIDRKLKKEKEKWEKNINELREKQRE